MTAMYVKISNGKVVTYPYTTLRLDHPNVSFPPVPTDDVLAQFDVYPVQRVPKPRCAWYQRVEEDVPVFQDGTWVQSWRLVDVATEARDGIVAAAKAKKLGELAAKRWLTETRGTTVNGIKFATDATSQTKLMGAAFDAQMEPGLAIKWKTADGTFVALDAPGMATIAKAVRAHVQACFDREAELRADIEKMCNPDAIAALDINTGWPE